MDVIRTFAEAEHTRRSRSPRGTRTVRLPVGVIHAARHGSAQTLCGVAVDQLPEFSSGRFPFERFPDDRRCPGCDDALR
jgi:hypothetical protein